MVALDWNGKGPRGRRPQALKARGERGPQGQPGQQGSEAKGDPGITDITVVTNFRPAGPAGANGNGVPGVGVDCPGDATATGGGGYALGGVLPNTGDVAATSTFLFLVASVPLEQNSQTNIAEAGDRPTGWFAIGLPHIFTNTLGVEPTPVPVTVYAVCATLASPV
jgi:hypothetical protein